MKVILFYISPNGTTRNITKALTQHFVQDNHEVVAFDLGKGGESNFQRNPEMLANADLIGIGSPVYHMKILHPVDVFLQNNLERIHCLNRNLKAFVYCTYGGVTTGKAFPNTLKLLKKHSVPFIGGMKIAAPHFWKVNGYPDDAALRHVQIFYSKLAAGSFKEIDWQRAKRLLQYQKPIVRMIYPFTGLIGRRRHLTIGIDQKTCIKCQKCIRSCPVSALTMQDYPVWDKAACLNCYHCTTVCPVNAVVCDTEKVKDMLKVNLRVVGKEEPQNAVFI